MRQKTIGIGTGGFHRGVGETERGVDMKERHPMGVYSEPIKIIQISAGAGGFYALGSDGRLWSYWWDVNLAMFKWTEIPLPF